MDYDDKDYEDCNNPLEYTFKPTLRNIRKYEKKQKND